MFRRKSHPKKSGRNRSSLLRIDSLEDRRLLATLIGLTEGNSLVLFDHATPGVTSPEIPITGLQSGEEILAIDVRPATGDLYGLGSHNRLYIIAPTTGAATFASSLSVPVVDDDADAYGFDFNPTVDRLRVVTDEGGNFRINVDTGAVIVDGSLVYNNNDVNDEEPEIAGSAYTNNFAGATTTMLYGIDLDEKVLVTQSPPNNGVLNTVGPLGIDLDDNVGFDIISFGQTMSLTELQSNGISQDPNIAVAAFQEDGDSVLYSINLATGLATKIGEIGDDIALRGLAADPSIVLPTPPIPPLDGGNLNFVLNLYDDVLDRQGDQGGVTYWVGELDSGKLSRLEVAQHFLSSPEYVFNLIQVFYQTFLGRTATTTFDPIANQFTGPEAFFFNKFYGDDDENDPEERIDDADREENIIREIVTSQEYALINGLLADGVIDSADSIPYVTALYRDILGRLPDAGGLAGFSQRLNNGASAASIVNEFVNSTELHIKLLTDAFGAIGYMEDWNNDYFDGMGSINDPEAQAALAALEDGDTWRSVQAALLATDAYFATVV